MTALIEKLLDRHSIFKDQVTIDRGSAASPPPFPPDDDNDGGGWEGDDDEGGDDEGDGYPNTVDEWAEQYGQEAIVNFIYNRHCSRFDPDNTDLRDALECAWGYKVYEDAIVDDLKQVAAYGDLDQYFRR